MEVDKINLDDWVRFGEGGNGQSFYHRTDDSLVLKLNDNSWTEEKALAEFNLSKTAFDIGVKCPEVFAFVTDGERFGFISKRVRKKMSFSRMIADNPSGIAGYASRFAAMARQLHSIECDTAVFSSALAQKKNLIDNCRDIPDDIRARLESICGVFDADACTCLHGDFHPGNLIAGEDGDYWIDLGNLSYGDPLLDIANLYMLAHYVPEKALHHLFHIDRRSFRLFVDEFLKCYYGDSLNEEMMAKIEKASLFRVALALCSSPKSAFIFFPLLRGRKLRFALRRWFSNLIMDLLAAFPDTAMNKWRRISDKSGKHPE